MTKTIALEEAVENSSEHWQVLVISCHFKQSPPRETWARGRQMEDMTAGQGVSLYLWPVIYDSDKKAPQGWKCQPLLNPTRSFKKERVWRDSQVCDPHPSQILRVLSHMTGVNPALNQVLALLSTKPLWPPRSNRHEGNPPHREQPCVSLVEGYSINTWRIYGSAGGLKVVTLCWREREREKDGDHTEANK